MSGNPEYTYSTLTMREQLHRLIIKKHETIQVQCYIIDPSACDENCHFRWVLCLNWIISPSPTSAIGLFRSHLEFRYHRPEKQIETHIIKPNNQQIYVLLASWLRCHCDDYWSSGTHIITTKSSDHHPHTGLDSQLGRMN